MVTSWLSVVAVAQFARPDLDAALVAETGELILAQRALEIAVDHGVDQVAVADPEHVRPTPPGC